MAGVESLREKMQPLLEGVRELEEIQRTQRLLRQPSLARKFTKPVQGNKVLRGDAIRKAYLECRYRVAAIARYAGVHYSTASKVIKGER